jgi:hypothetical protein
MSGSAGPYTPIIREGPDEKPNERLEQSLCRIENQHKNHASNLLCRHQAAGRKRSRCRQAATMIHVIFVNVLFALN